MITTQSGSERHHRSTFAFILYVYHLFQWSKSYENKRRERISCIRFDSTPVELEEELGLSALCCQRRDLFFSPPVNHSILW